jgi:hypothetical protein
MPSNDPAAGAQVTTDQGANRFYVWYLSSLAVVGTALILLGVKDVLGTWAFVVGGFLVVGGVGGLISMAATGGAGKVSCPSCGTSIKVLHISMSRLERCSGCGVYLEGAKVMQVVPPDRIEKGCCFSAPLPEKWAWPEGCPVCGGPVTRTVTVEGIDAPGTLTTMISPIAVVRISKIEAPCCAAHADGVGLTRDGKETSIGFRSIAYWRRFCELNGIETGPRRAAAG